MLLSHTIVYSDGCIDSLLMITEEQAWLEAGSHMDL